MDVSLHKIAILLKAFDRLDAGSKYHIMHLLRSQSEAAKYNVRMLHGHKPEVAAFFDCLRDTNDNIRYSEEVHNMILEVLS